MVAEPLELTPPARMAPATTYPPQVEQWRETVAKYFPADQVDKVLYVINGESGGNPTIPGDGGAAYGLFQSHHIPSGASVEEQFKDAARLYNSDLNNGGTGYGDWGEGRLYDYGDGRGPVPFGALGRAPYGGYAPPATSTTATSNVVPPGEQNLVGADFSAALTKPAFDTTAFSPGENTGSSSPLARIGKAATGLVSSAADAIGSVPGVEPLTSVVNSGVNTVVDAASDVGNAVVDFASRVPGKVLEAPFLRANPADQIAAVFDKDPTTSPAGVAISQAGPAEDQQYPLGQSIAAKVARSVTNPVNYVGSTTPLALGLDAASGAASPIGEEVASAVGAPPVAGGFIAGALPYVGAGVSGGVRAGIKEGDDALAAAADEPPPPQPKTPVEQLRTHIQSAGAARPDLLAARTAERAKRFNAAADALEQGGVPAREAFDRATAQLGGGQLADDAFVPPTALDTDTLYQQIVDYAKANRDASGFTIGKAASDGLKLLEEGRIPRPFEVEALGKVFGPELQTAIDELGDVFKVKRAVETAMTGRADPVPLDLGPSGELTAANITAAVKSLLPKASPKSLQIAVQRLIDEDRLVATIGTDGKPKLQLRGPQIDALGETIRREAGIGDVPPVPAQVVPPGQRSLFDEEQAVAQPTSGPADYTIPPSESTGPTLSQLRLNRGLKEAPNTTFQGEGGSVPPPKNPASGAQGSFGWEPGGTPLWKKTGKFALDALGLLPRAFQTAYDYSYPFRQGALLIRHQKEFWANFTHGIRALANEDFARARQAQIERAPYNPRTLDITHFDPKRSLTQMEEDFMTRLGNMIPGIRQSQRAATVFINGLRSDVANQFVRTQLRYGRSLQDIMKDADIYGNYLNRATGRGNLGNFESQLPLLNQVFYGLRRNVAMVQAPGYLFNSNAAVRKEVWLDFLAFFGVGVSTLKMAELAGADVGIDPTDADFGKIRVGDTRVDIWGGYQQLARLVYKLADGQIKDPGSSEAFAEAALPYLGNKLAPTLSTGIKQSDSLRNALYPGQSKPGLTAAAANAFLPLGAQGLIDAIREDGAAGGVLGLTGFFGTGVQAYVAAEDIGADEIADGIRSGILPATYLDKNGQQQPVTNLRQLAAADPEAADKFLADNPAIAKDRYEAYGELTRNVRDRQQQLFDRQTDRDNELLATNPAEWRKASGDDANLTRAAIDALYESAGEYKREPETLLDVANQKYHEAIVAATDKKKQKVDWDAVDRAVANFSPAEQELIFKSSLKGETEVRKQYLRDIKQLGPYFDQRDEAWASISEGNSELGRFETFDDYRQSLVDTLMAAGLSHTLAQDRADKAVGGLGRAVSAQANAYLASHQDLIPMLDQWGFFVPSVFQGLTLR